MKKLKKKIVKKRKHSLAFTLIELLAVILILGIIALIAIPQVSKVIETSKRGAAEVSSTNYVRTVNEQIIENKLDGNPANDIEDGEYDVSLLDIEMSGNKPNSGTIVIKKGKVEEANLNIDGYVIHCNGEEQCSAAREAEITYVYYQSVGNGLTSINDPEKKLERPTDYSVYAKYPVINNELGSPEVCFYDKKEICFKANDYENSKNKILTHFKDTTKCNNTAVRTNCWNDLIQASAENDHIYLSGESGFSCETSETYPVSCTD